MAPDFRHILKDRTQLDHSRVDHALSEFDVATRDGLRLFLEVHHACFSQMRHVSDQDSDTAASLTDMIDRIDADLKVLGGRPTDLSPVISGPIDGLACAYLIEGSRLGSKILARRWASSGDAVVNTANAYFTLEPVKGRWRAVCDALADVPSDSPRAETIVRDTSALFGLFLRAALAVANTDMTDKVRAS